jgi:hypothetical protein
MNVVSMFTRAAEERPTEDAIRTARLKFARRCNAWVEIENDLVARGRWLVSASTDFVYAPVLGIVFHNGSAAIVSDQARYFFTVAPDGTLAFYERLPETWTEIYERKARRDAARGR